LASNTAGDHYDAAPADNGPYGDVNFAAAT
jgi:hypothetical protein